MQKHLGNLKDGKLFNDFKQCMFTYDDRKNLKNHGKKCSWAKFVSNFWLDSIYELKNKCARVCMRRPVTLEKGSTQLSESPCRSKVYTKYDLNIVHSFKHSERIVNDKHHRELEAKFHPRQQLSNLTCLILWHAVSVYTQCRLWTRATKAQAQDASSGIGMLVQFLGYCTEDMSWIPSV